MHHLKGTLKITQNELFRTARGINTRNNKLLPTWSVCAKRIATFTSQWPHSGHGFDFRSTSAQLPLVWEVAHYIISRSA